jgi:hypothetical protein
MPRQAAAAAEAVTEVEEDAEPGDQEERWARLLPELLSEVVRRVEASGCERWPARKDVVSCACVCRRWRDAAVAVVRPPAESGKITFPSSLKQVRTEAAVRAVLRARVRSIGGLSCRFSARWCRSVRPMVDFEKGLGDF